VDPLQWMPRRRLPVWVEIALGWALAVVAAGVRLALNFVLADTVAFITFFPAVVIAAAFGGRIAAATALVCSAVIGTLLWAAPAGPLAPGLPALVSFLVSGALCGAVVALLREALVARWIDEENRRASSEAPDSSG
jgi:K+-sensing histidine kinase KdpD